MIYIYGHLAQHGLVEAVDPTLVTRVAIDMRTYIEIEIYIKKYDKYMVPSPADGKCISNMLYMYITLPSMVS